MSNVPAIPTIDPSISQTNPQLWQFCQAVKSNIDSIQNGNITSETQATIEQAAAQAANTAVSNIELPAYPETDMSAPDAIDNLTVTGGVLYNFLEWGTNPSNTDHVEIWRASSILQFIAGTLTLNGNATVDGNSISKPSPTLAWDTQAYSSQSFTSSGAVQFSFASTELMCEAGLDTSPTTRTDIDFCIRSNGDGTFNIYENGTDTTITGSFTETDVFEIGYSSTSVTYKKNGTTLRTATTTSGQTFYFDSTYYDYLSEVKDINIGAYQSITKYIPGTLTLNTTGNADTVVVSGTTATKATGRPTVSKTAGATAWDSHAYSSESYTGDCALRFSAYQTTRYLAVGLNSDPTTDASAASIDYSIRCGGDGLLRIYESNTLKGTTWGAYTTDDVLEIEYSGTTITYKKNGTTLTTTTTTAGREFYFDSSYYDVWTTAKAISFGQYVNSVYEPNTLTLNTTGSASTLAITYSTTWDSQVYSTQSYTSSCALRFKFGQTNLRVMCGLNSSTDLTDSGYSTLDYAIYGYNDGHFYIWESNTNIGDQGTYTANDLFEIEYTSTSVIYKKNGVTIRTATTTSGRTFYVDSSFADVGASITEIQFGQYGSVSEFSLAPITLNNTGSTGTVTISETTATKSAGTGAWDSHCYSSQSYTSACQVKFSFGTNTYYAMAGINTDPTTDANYTSLDYAIFAQVDGDIEVYESGESVGAYGSYTNTDVFEIEYYGNTINYKKNGEIFRTIATAPDQTFYFDSSLYSVGASIKEIQFGPGLILNGDATLSVHVATKPSIAVAWDKQGYSTETITANKGIRFSFPSTNLIAAAGIDTNPSGNYDSIDYAIRSHTDGTIHIWENDIDAGSFGEFTPLDIFQIEYTGSEVVYKKNGENLRVVAAEASQTFYLDASLYHYESAVDNLAIGSITVLSSRADAALVGTSKTRLYADYIPDGSDNDYYYWVRSVSPAGVEGYWNLVDGEISEAGTAATPMGIGDAQVTSISASKIICYALSALTANMGELTAGIIKSPDETFIINLEDKSITISGPNGASADDYTLIKNGEVQFYKWTGATHQEGNSLQTIESGEASNGETVTLEKWYSKIPHIIPFPKRIPLYKAAYSAQNQTLDFEIKNVQRSSSGVVTFEAVSRLLLDATASSTTVNQSSGATSSNTYTSTTYTTAANTTKITVALGVKSLRGTGAAPNYAYRRVQARIGYRVNGVGSYVYTSYVTINMLNNFNTYSLNVATGTLSANTYQFFVQYVASDRGGTFANGVGGYLYHNKNIYLASNTSLVEAFSVQNQITDNALFSLPAYSADAGYTDYSIYNVTYHISYGYYVSSGTGARASINNSVGVSLYSVNGQNIAGTINVPSANASYSYSTPSYTQNPVGLDLTASGSGPSSYNPGRAQVKFFAAGTYATVQTRKLQTNSATPSNTFTLKSYSVNISGSTVLGSGTLNYVVIEDK